MILPLFAKVQPLPRMMLVPLMMPSFFNLFLALIVPPEMVAPFSILTVCAVRLQLLTLPEIVMTIPVDSDAPVTFTPSRISIPSK